VILSKVTRNSTGEVRALPKDVNMLKSNLAEKSHGTTYIAEDLF